MCIRDSYGDGGLQFVGDVVGEIALHLLQCLLFQDGAYQEPEGESEYNQDEEVYKRQATR